MATLTALKKCVNKAIQNECRRVKRLRRAHPGNKHKNTDYAAAVVACGYTNSDNVFIGFSASPVGIHFVKKIQERLEKLGSIGKKRNGCGNIIGACAEPHAANEVLRHFPGCNTNKLQFSETYRPRTGGRINYCKNCKVTFNEVL